MAQLRLIALVAAVGCRASEAGPTSGLAVPQGWQPLPELATAAREASKTKGITVDAVEAWGEPSRGCFGAWLAITGNPGAVSGLAEQMLANMTMELPNTMVTNVTRPAAGADTGVLSLSFSRAPYAGRARAQLTKGGSHAVLVCFWNGREPAACDAACTGLIGSMK